MLSIALSIFPFLVFLFIILLLSCFCFSSAISKILSCSVFSTLSRLLNLTIRYLIGRLFFFLRIAYSSFIVLYISIVESVYEIVFCFERSVKLLSLIVSPIEFVLSFSFLSLLARSSVIISKWVRISSCFTKSFSNVCPV